MIGTVVRWDASKRYGFLKTGGKREEIFAHERRVVKGPLYAGATVTFSVYTDLKLHPLGKCATNIRVVRE